MDSKDGHEVDFRRDVNPNAVYELTALLGEGSYGAVYRGRSRIGNDLNEVAIKIIPDADDDLTALWREIRFLQVLRSPFVVSFIESLLFDNELWLVMELCDGGSLHDLKEAMKTTFNEKQLKVIIAFRFVNKKLFVQFPVIFCGLSQCTWFGTFAFTDEYSQGELLMFRLIQMRLNKSLKFRT
jgi:hypothetical protein